MFTSRRFLVYLAGLLALVLLVGGGSPVAAAAPGDVVINEIMQNPNAVFDSAGEWFELYNATGADIDIDGWTILDNGSDSHVINNGGPLLIPAGGYLVLGNNTDTGTNGGAPVAYSYGSSWFLSNSADEVVLLDSSAIEIDRVEYDGGPSFPDPTGASMALSDPALDNNVGANWCTASTPYGAGDFGTPGAANDCPVTVPVVVINEIMQNPNAVFDSAGEWFELYNPTGADIDIDGWTILDNGSDSHVINNGGPLLIPAGGYLVLGNNTDTGTNGGAPVAYSYGSSWFLSNSADEVVLLDGSLNEVDRVEYDGGPSFPDPTGASMALVDPALDNNVGANWCTASTPYGAGDLGTPGAANDCVSPPPALLINELDADQASTDSAEFIELYDGGTGGTDLTGLVLVLFNGSDDASYNSFDLDSYSTNASGYFVLCGDAGNVANCDLDVSPDTNLIQNGADAAALFQGDASDFPNDTPVTTTNLIDAIVYDTGDADDPGLLVLLNAGQPQVDEQGGGNGTLHSNQRCPNGSGGARNTDTYAQYAPTPGDENLCVQPPLTCTDGSVITLIHDIQGNGATSPLVGSAVVIDGVVVGDFQNNGQPDNGDLLGFYVQEEDTEADADPLTSEGIFVFDFAAATDVMVGDHVRVSGTVSEYSTSGGASLTTELGLDQVAVCAASAPMPAATSVNLPVTDVSDFERYEGMRVTFPQSLSISEYYNFDRFGEIVLTLGRQHQPTAVYEPGSPEAANLAIQNALGRITLDDGRSSSNLDPAIHPNGNVFSTTNLFRGGDEVMDATGVMDDAFGLYRIQPTQGAGFTVTNPRPVAHDPVGGSLKVASFNVLNYFSTLDDSGPICGPNGDQGCRGADDANEFTRQRDKIFAALQAIDADIVGLMEIENHATDAAVQDLVAGLNAVVGAGTYDYIATGPIGTDAIKVAFIYKPATVTPVGGYALLDSSVDPRFDDTRNRPALAQTFMENTPGGANVTVVVNHLKSKGSPCGPGDDDPQQGNCNLTRTLAAQALVDWLATDPTNSGDQDVIIIGDLNSYDKEDPIDQILLGADDTTGTADDYTDLAFAYGGEYAYSYLFDGQLGYLDYGMAVQHLVSQVTGTTVWHINADEPDILDYDTSFKPPGIQALYEPNAYRASDHDPVIVGMDLTASPDCSTAVPSQTTLWPANHRFQSIDILNVTDPAGNSVSITITGIFSDEPVNAPGSGHTSPDGRGIGTSTAEVRAERSGVGDGRFYHIYFTASDAQGNGCQGQVRVNVPHDQAGTLPIDGGPLYDVSLPE